MQRVTTRLRMRGKTRMRGRMRVRGRTRMKLGMRGRTRRRDRTRSRMRRVRARMRGGMGTRSGTTSVNFNGGAKVPLAPGSSTADGVEHRTKGEAPEEEVFPKALAYPRTGLVDSGLGW